jgi:hypothetical protein
LRVAVRRIPPDVWAVGALTLLAAVIRFATIASQSYWADEALTVYEVHLRFSAMLTTVANTETTPPLYFIIAWAWAHVLGTGEAALRSLSALAGIAVVPIAYLGGRDLVSRRAGVIAAAFAAFNPFLIWYSQEARAYMLLMTLTAASFLWFIRAEREPSRRNIVWWAVFSALALATHFFAGFLVAPEVLWLLWRARSRDAIIAAGALAAGRRRHRSWDPLDPRRSAADAVLADLDRVRRQRRLQACLGSRGALGGRDRARDRGGATRCRGEARRAAGRCGGGGDRGGGHHRSARAGAGQAG